MIEVLSIIIKLVIIIKVAMVLAKWLFFRKKRKGKSILGKLFQLANNHIHHKLDVKLKKQYFKLHPSRKYKKGDKVIPLRKTN